MTALPNKCYSGCHKATEEEDNRETLGKEIWRGKCGHGASGLAGGRWRRQHKIKCNGDERSVAFAPLGVARHSTRILSRATVKCQILVKLSIIAIIRSQVAMPAAYIMSIYRPLNELKYIHKSKQNNQLH